MSDIIKIVESEKEVERLTALKKRLVADIETKIKAEVDTQAALWVVIADEMKDNGVLSSDYPAGTGIAYRISYSTPRESIIEPESLDAVPEGLIRTKREFNKLEAKKLLDECREGGKPLPNWLQVKLSEPTLCYRIIKS